MSVPQPDRPSSSLARVLGRGSWRRRLAAAGLAVIVLGAALSWPAGWMVDWGMDGDLTPGVWEPRHWWIGTFLSLLFLPAVAWPVTLVLAIALPVCGILATRPARVRCPACDRPLPAHAADCAACGPIPPRRPRRGDRRELARTTLVVVALLLGPLPPVALVACGIAWVQLEREEDAFAERAQAAAASGLTSYQETSRYGSTLGWRVEDGYWSHRD